LVTKHWNLLKAIKHWNFLKATKHLNLLRATKHLNLSKITKHWKLPQAIKLGFSFSSFFFLLFKGMNSSHLGLFFSGHNFQFEFWENLFLQFPLGGEE
jgi:hypothetical protein